jgi:hypothetical protein
LRRIKGVGTYGFNNLAPQQRGPVFGKAFCVLATCADVAVTGAFPTVCADYSGKKQLA